MADSKEVREKKKYVKALYDLNQYVKNVYKGYTIYGQKGIIIGIPVKDKFANSVYMSNIVQTHPFLENTMLESDKVYDCWREDKPDEIEVIDNEIYITDSVTNHPFIVGKKIEITEAFRSRYVKALEELDDFFKNGEFFSFTEEEVNKLIGYEQITKRLNDDPAYEMILAISEFPLLKKFKSLGCYLRDYGKKVEYFDVLYVTKSNSGEAFYMKRRFLKME